MNASGSYIHIPPAQHKCPVPHVDDPIGTVWQCDTCRTYWHRVEQYVGFGCSTTWTTHFWRNVKSGNLHGYLNAVGGGA